MCLGDKVKHLIVSSEHPDYKITGGMGSYVKEALSLRKGRAGLLLVDFTGEYDQDLISKHKWLDLESVLGRQELQRLVSADFNRHELAIMYALVRVISENPQIESVEFYEPGAYHSIQAKMAGLLPGDLKIITMCHGSSLHLARSQASLLHPMHSIIAYREKFVLERSDHVYYPTNFLKESYDFFGIQTDSTNNSVRRLPFNLSHISKGAELTAHDRLFYLGKTSTQKGFDVFLQTLIELGRAGKKYKSITCAVTSVEMQESVIKDLFEKASEHYSIDVRSFPRRELMDFLSVNSKDTLALMTYTGDNHPNGILELLAIGFDFLLLDKAGSPELIPDSQRDMYICDPNPQAVAQRAIEAHGKIAERSQRLIQNRNNYHIEQDQINQQYNSYEGPAECEAKELKRAFVLRECGAVDNVIVDKLGSIKSIELTALGGSLKQMRDFLEKQKDDSMVLFNHESDGFAPGLIKEHVNTLRCSRGDDILVKSDLVGLFPNGVIGASSVRDIGSYSVSMRSSALLKFTQDIPLLPLDTARLIIGQKLTSNTGHVVWIPPSESQTVLLECKDSRDAGGEVVDRLDAESLISFTHKLVEGNRFESYQLYTKLMYDQSEAEVVHLSRDILTFLKVQDIYHRRVPSALRGAIYWALRLALRSAVRLKKRIGLWF